jgi:hypothetical protein
MEEGRQAMMMTMQPCGKDHHQFPPALPKTATNPISSQKGEEKEEEKKKKGGASRNEQKRGCRLTTLTLRILYEKDCGLARSYCDCAPRGWWLSV